VVVDLVRWSPDSYTGTTDRNNYGGDAQLPAGLDRSTLMETARVSGLIHVVFGHSPVLLEMLQKGCAFSAHVEQVMRSCQQPDFRSISSPSMTVPSAHTFDLIAHAVSWSVVPTVVEHNHQVLIRAHASVVDLFHPSAQHGASTSDTMAYPHPYLLRQLQKFMDPYNDTLGFRTIQQAMVTQLMYERQQHILYVSQTGV
jgi:hypothetical protein